LRTTEGLLSIGVSNVLSEEKRQQVIALGRLGWPLRRIQQETGIRRETAGAYLKAAGVAIRAPGGWGRRVPAKPANEVFPDPSTASPAGSAQNRPTRATIECHNLFRHLLPFPYALHHQGAELLRPQVPQLRSHLP